VKISKALFVSVIVGIVFLSSTACGNTANPTPSVSPTTLTEPAIEKVQTAEDSIEVEYVLDTLNGYYSFISHPDSAKRIREAGATLTGREATDEELQQFASDFSEAFQYFDTSSSQKIKKAYKAMMMGANAGIGRNEVEISALPEGVTVSGDTATFNTSWVIVSEEGKTFPSERVADPDPSDLINFVKKDEGHWVIVAKDASLKVTAP
jgi:hypothetical protein